LWLVVVVGWMIERLVVRGWAIGVRGECSKWLGCVSYALVLRIPCRLPNATYTYKTASLTDVQNMYERHSSLTVSSPHDKI
jgi:hypothetical protein